MSVEEGDAHYGIPILRARWQLLPDRITFPAVLARDRRFSIGNPRFVPGDPWQYERLAPPARVERERWASWEHQQADPVTKAEAERRMHFFNASAELLKALEAGQLQGFGRRNSVAGDWIAIPQAAWRLLRFEFDPEFTSWRNGRAVGGGLDLWGVRILDKAGATLHAASLIYGPPEDAATAQRFLAYFALARNRLNLRENGDLMNSALASRMIKSGLLDNDIALPSEKQFREAISNLHYSLVRELREGRLVGSGLRGGVERTALSRSDWINGSPDFTRSALHTHRLLFTDVQVRQPDPATSPSSNKVDSPLWSLADVEPWWADRMASNKSDRWPFSEADDVAAAQGRFPGLTREAVRRLRDRLGDKVKPGLRQAIGKLPPKAAAQL